MFDTHAHRGATRCALALCAALALPAAAQAGFTVSVNGRVVATDNGVGDLNPTGHEITFADTVYGYLFRITTSASSSGGGAGIQTPQLQVVQAGGHGPLTVEITSTFDQPPGTGNFALTGTLTRDTLDGFGTSGMVRMTTTAQSDSGGGSGSTGTISLDQNQGSGTAGSVFSGTSDSYSVTQTYEISGLGDGKAVSLSGDSEVIPDPAPPGAVLMLSGVGFFGAGWFVRRRLKN